MTAKDGRWCINRCGGIPGKWQHSEVLGITLYSHRDLEQLRRGFNAAYNARRQRVLDGKTPNQVVAERLQSRHQLANVKTHDRAGPDDIAQARLIVEAAK